MEPGRATIVGVGEDGAAGLGERARAAIARARVLAGAGRHLELFPEFVGERMPIAGGIAEAMGPIEERLREGDVSILASGDPLFFGIGSHVVRRLGKERVEVIPHATSVQEAFARLGMPWDDATWISLHGGELEGFLTRLRRLSKVAVLTDEENHPARLAAHMIDLGETGWRAWVGEDLGAPEERVRALSLEEIAAATGFAALNVLVLERTASGWRPPPVLPDLPDEAFFGRVPPGAVTPREVRALALGALAIRPDSVVWDVGAGSGALAAEAGLLAFEGRIYAIERDPERAAACLENLRKFAADNVRVVRARAPEVLDALEDPDAIFVDAGRRGLRKILEACLERLWSGGRLVVVARTLEDAAAARTTFRNRGLVPEALQLRIERGASRGPRLSYRPLRPLHLFWATKR